MFIVFAIHIFVVLVIVHDDRVGHCWTFAGEILLSALQRHSYHVDLHSHPPALPPSSATVVPQGGEGQGQGDKRESESGIVGSGEGGGGGRGGDRLPRLSDQEQRQRDNHADHEDNNDDDDVDEHTNNDIDDLPLSSGFPVFEFNTGLQEHLACFVPGLFALASQPTRLGISMTEQLGLMESSAWHLLINESQSLMRTGL